MVIKGDKDLLVFPSFFTMIDKKVQKNVGSTVVVNVILEMKAATLKCHQMFAQKNVASVVVLSVEW